MFDIGKDLQDAYECGRQDALAELMEYTYGMLTAEKFGLQHKIKSMMSDRKTEPTVSKMEQVDKDINVRSKDEPKTDMAEDIVRSYGFKAESYQQAKAKDEPQKWEKPPKFDHKGIQTACVTVPACLLEFEDEPQIFICPIQDNYEALIEDEPQTERESR